MGKYFFRYRNRATDPYPTLVEMSPQEARDELAKAKGTSMTYKPVSASEARKWVKDGGHHETGLYTDCDGRIRYATGGEF